ncbi:hypothetical protein GW17_00025655 [Ensete ventricosum]|nr:hypothetical protein GW17_00025655 [Ensete ventricosum]
MITHRGRRREGESYRSPPRALTLVGRRRRPAPTTSSSLIPSAVKPGESCEGSWKRASIPRGAPRAPHNGPRDRRVAFEPRALLTDEKIPRMKSPSTVHHRQLLRHEKLISSDAVSIVAESYSSFCRCGSKLTATAKITSLVAAT